MLVGSAFQYDRIVQITTVNCTIDSQLSANILEFQGGFSEDKLSTSLRTCLYIMLTCQPSISVNVRVSHI